MWAFLGLGTFRRERGPRSTAEDPIGRRRVRVVGLAVATIMLVTVAATLPASAHQAMGTRGPKSFHATNLVADNASFGPKLVDPNQTNGWGLAAAPNSYIWVSDNNSGNASVYGGNVSGPVSLVLTVPVPGGNPTGQVYNSTGGFPVGGPSGPSALFIVASDSIGAAQSPGEIAAWSSGPSFVVEDSPTGGPGGTPPAGAVFKGLAIANTSAGPELFATDVANARVDVFDQSFAPRSTPTEFVDPAVPAGYTPFGIEALKGAIFVTYGLQNASKTDVVQGPGLGYVDMFSVNGTLLRHLVSGGANSHLDAPWGLAIAPRGFGHFSNKLLVGNLGDGKVNVFNPKKGKFLGTITSSNGAPITIPGLWGLKVGNTAFGGPSSVIFSAGPTGYADGIVGVLTFSR